MEPSLKLWPPPNPARFIAVELYTRGTCRCGRRPTAGTTDLTLPSTIGLDLQGDALGTLKRSLTKALANVGYEVRRLSAVHVEFANYANLVKAYEQRLNESGNPVPVSDTRARLLARLQGTPPSEAYFIVQALLRSRDVAGEVCEFGVAQGETSALIASEIRAGSKVLHLFDSFEGLSVPTDRDQLKDDIFSLGSIEAYAGSMSCPEGMVRARLGAISFPQERVAIHRGFVDRVFSNGSGLPKEVSFAYVDFDLYEPIRLTLQYLHRATSPGSIVIVDDYDFFSTGVKTAVDEFVECANSSGCVYELVVPNPEYGRFAVLTRRG